MEKIHATHDIEDSASAKLFLLDGQGWRGAASLTDSRLRQR